MLKNTVGFLSFAVLVVVIALSARAHSQEVFNSGKIGITEEASDAKKIEVAVPPKGSPNIVVILLDDVGFSAADVFGGVVEMPTLRHLAEEGLRYTRFHTAGICSATRAALLTGSNHHRVNTPAVMNMPASGYPGHTNMWPASAASVAEILREIGYSTAAFGKWHNTPSWEESSVGPFDRWPVGKGFDYFYGFLGGDTDQWVPNLIENTVPVSLPEKKDDYHFTSDMADKAIGWIRRQNAIAPGKPFLLYFAPGATHAPHQAPKEWIEKYKGRFDKGWDYYRERALARQKKLGIVPQATRLSQRPREVDAWGALGPVEKKIYARMMEVYAGFLAHTDYEVGRMLGALGELGVRENTMVIYIVGDNGAGREGGRNGSVNEVKSFFYPDSVEDILPHVDQLGGPETYNHYPVGWAWATNSPFPYWKSVVSHLGGTRNPLVINWPGHTEKGGIRAQFHHVIDMVPTILDAAGIKAPYAVKGLVQQQMDGVSMRYTFLSDGGKKKSARRLQYFAIEGNLGLYEDEWFLSRRKNGDWELYELKSDFSQSNNVASEFPEKLSAMQQLLWAEAGKNNVLPLRSDTRVHQQPTVDGDTTRSRYVYTSGVDRIPEAVSPPIKNRSYSIEVEVTISEQGAEGVLVAEGGKFGGYSLYVKDLKLIYHYNWFNNYRYQVVSNIDIPVGKASLGYRFEYDGSGIGKGGLGRLYINGNVVGQVRVERTVPHFFTLNETFDVGKDYLTTVSPEYTSPYTFTGVIDRLIYEIK